MPKTPLPLHAENRGFRPEQSNRLKDLLSYNQSKRLNCGALNSDQNFYNMRPSREMFLNERAQIPPQPCEILIKTYRK